MPQLTSPLASIPKWILLARILRPQGRRGEVLAELFTDFPNRFTERPEVWLAASGFTEADPERSAVAPDAAEVTGHWLPVGKNAGRIVLRFAGVDSIEAAERLAGREVVVPAAQRMPLEPDASYISDLIGCAVFDGPEMIGTVQDVQFPTTPDGSRRIDEAAPLLSVISADGTEMLIPFVKAYLIQVDTGARRILMSLPEGLMDINRPTRS